MKIKVIRVTQAGQVGYVKSATIFGAADPVVSNPFEAKNYMDSQELQEDLDNLYISGDELYARIGVKVDSAEVVEFQLSAQELSAVTGRPLHTEK